MDKLTRSMARRVASRYIQKDAGVPDWMKALPKKTWSLIKKFIAYELQGAGWGHVVDIVGKEVGKDEAKKLEKDRRTKKKFEDWADKEKKKARLK